MVRKVSGARRVSVTEVRELLKQPFIRDEAMTKSSLCDVYLLSDGRVLLYYGEGNPGTLYPSRAALEELDRQLAALAEKHPIDLTETLLPPVADFLRDVGTFAEKLGAALRIPNEALDRTQESLDAVDKGFWRLAAAKRMMPEVVTPLVAYVGEVMRIACSGRWAPRDRTNEPMVIAPDGHPFQPFAIVIGELERGRRGSLRGAVSGTVHAHRLSGPQKGRAGT